jgi:hypothetical protein
MNPVHVHPLSPILGKMLFGNLYICMYNQIVYIVSNVWLNWYNAKNKMYTGLRLRFSKGK